MVFCGFVCFPNSIVVASVHMSSLRSKGWLVLVASATAVGRQALIGRENLLALFLTFVHNFHPCNCVCGCLAPD